MRRLILLPMALLALAVTAGVGLSDDKDDTAADEARLKASYLATDGASLVDFLSTRARGETSRAEMAKLIEDLETGSLTAKQKAAARIVAIGAPAVPALRMAAREIDAPDLSSQAKALLKALEDDPGALSTSAIRLLGARRPPGTADALLAYLPHAETDSVLEELRNVLAGVAYEKGKPAPVMIAALSDPHALRRATAIQALCQGGIPEPRAAFRKLLNDVKPSVRLRAAIALAQASDPKAVSTLITLLTDVPLEQGKEIEAILQEMAGELAPKAVLTDDPIGREKAREVWARWWLDTEGPWLLEELRRRTLSEEDLAHTQKLIEQMGDDVFEERQKAEEALKKLGSKILPLLKQAKAANADLEVRNRSGKCIDAIEKDKTPPLALATPRLMALRKPKGAVEAILAYAPFVDDETMMDELQTALNAVAYTGDKPHPALAKAAEDKAASRRAAAGVALCAGPIAEAMPLIRKLIADKDAAVRAKVALALAGAKEPEAVPALFKVLEDGPAELSATAEEYLSRLARDGGPKEPADDGKKKAAAWAKWWEENKTKVVMLDRNAPTGRAAYLGLTILVKAGNNEVGEYDKGWKEKWKITGLLNPWDAQWLPGNRVLIAEYNGTRVTERDTKTGAVKWEKTGLPSNPMQAERLKNGNTFIVCRNALVEVDKAGTEKFRLNRPGYDVYTARRLPSGAIVLVTTNRQVYHFDKTGKETHMFNVPEIHYFQNEILDNGNVLIPLGFRNQVTEFDKTGKKVGELTTTQPTHAIRLPSGGTLVLSQNWPNPVTEFDKTGKQVSSHNTNAYCFRVRRR